MRDDPYGSRLEVTFRFHKLVIALLVLFAAGQATGFFGGGGSSPAPLLALAALVLLLSAIGFAPEVKEAKTLLTAALGGLPHRFRSPIVRPTLPSRRAPVVALLARKSTGPPGVGWRAAVFELG